MALEASLGLRFRSVWAQWSARARVRVRVRVRARCDDVDCHGVRVWVGKGSRERDHCGCMQRRLGIEVFNLTHEIGQPAGTVPPPAAHPEGSSIRAVTARIADARVGEWSSARARRGYVQCETPARSERQPRRVPSPSTSSNSSSAPSSISSTLDHPLSCSLGRTLGGTHGRRLDPVALLLALLLALPPPPLRTSLRLSPQLPPQLSPWSPRRAPAP